MFKCSVCDKRFTRRDNRKRHENVHTDIVKDGLHECIVCGLQILQTDELEKHLARAHNIIKKPEQPADASVVVSAIMKRQLQTVDDDANEASSSSKKQKTQNTILCEVCGVEVSAGSYGAHQKSNGHKENIYVHLRDNIEVSKFAFKKRIVSYKITNTDYTHLSIDKFFESNRAAFVDLLKLNLEKHITVKVNLELFANYFILKKDQIVSELKSFNTKNIIFNAGTDIDATLTDFKTKIIKKSEEFQEKDSGWSLQKIAYIELNIMKYNPLRASSYIDLPKKIKEKKACVNVQNNDHACFAWAIVSALFPASQSNDRITSYPHYSEVLNLNGLEFPMTIKNIKKFESLNDFVSVNVFSLDEHCNIVGPLYSTLEKKTNHVNLLYISDDMSSNNHYVWIRNLSRLVSSQLNAQQHKKFICDCCLTYFDSENLLERHCEFDCGKVRVKLPSEELKKDRLGRESPGNIINFKNYERKELLPFVIYADSETVLKPIHTVTPDSTRSFTVPLKQHVPHSFSYYIKCNYDDSLSKLEIFNGNECTINFIQSLVTDAKNIYKILNQVVPLRQLRSEEIESLRKDKTCHICERSFSADESDTIVLDHNHLTGEPRGYAHGICNLNYQTPKFIPVFFHNLSNFDSHLFIKQLASVCDDISVIPINKEKYISFSAKFPLSDDDENANDDDDNHFINKKRVEIRFLDSFRFLSCSLSKLAKTMREEDFVELRKQYSDIDQFQLVTDKGIFPYEYITSLNVLNETELPPIEAFYSELNNENITEKEYEQAKKVWMVFKCETLLDYSNNYLKTDVLLLCDIFEKFRKVELATYQLDPACYYTLPGLSWDAMLRYTNVNLELMSDIDMVHFIRKSLRGGISSCVKRHCAANNKYMTNEYNPNIPSSFITYLDANNLYGYALSQPLPTGGFSWLTEDEIKNFDVKNLDDNSESGCFVEADLEYPEHLHHSHNDFPFCAEKKIPPSAKSKQTKLLTTLDDKDRYILHYRYLKQCLEHGLVLKKIHRVLRFSQSCFLKTYIDRNTELRALAESDFEKDLYKLKNNACYGKSIESVEKRVDVRLVCRWERHGKKRGAEHFISQPNFHSIAIFDSELAAVQMKRLSVEYNKPNYIGAAVLDLSKCLMYDFFYNYLKKKFNFNLLYSDTDSFLLEVFTDDVYEDIKADLHLFDTSNFPADNEYGLPLVNKKVVGKFKFETAANLIVEYVGLRSKMYCFRLFGSANHCHKRAKGVKTNVVDKQLTFDDYLHCLHTGETLMCQMCVFRSVKHEVQVQKNNKIALSAADDKRHLLEDSHETLAWGHYKLNQ